MQFSNDEKELRIVEFNIQNEFNIKNKFWEISIQNSLNM